MVLVWPVPPDSIVWPSVVCCAREPRFAGSSFAWKLFDAKKRPHGVPQQSARCVNNDSAVRPELRPKAPAVLQLLIYLTTKSPGTFKGSLLLHLRRETSGCRAFSALAPLQILTSVPRATGRCALRSVSTPWAATGASVTKATRGRRTARRAPKGIKVYMLVAGWG